MGYHSEMLLEREGLISTAQEIAVEAGALEECENHPGTYISMMDSDAEKLAYAYGSKAVNDGVAGTDDHKKFSAAMESALLTGGDSCPCCDKNRRDDD